MAIKLGLDAKLFRGTAGTQGTIEVTNVKDVSLSLESGEADVTTRKAKGWETERRHTQGSLARNHNPLRHRG